MTTQKQIQTWYILLAVVGLLVGARDVCAANYTWMLDIFSLAKPGENRIEILVCNTLANHYSTVPTRFRGSPI
jgi:hypothetical protein